MSEKSLWNYTRTGLSQAIPSHERRITRVENAAGQGTPDVTYCIRGKAGWLELKFLEKFPHRKDTVVRCEHFTTEQRTFMHDESMAGGRAFLWVQVGSEYFLFDGLEAAMHFDRGDRSWTKEDFKKKALFYHKKGNASFDWEAFTGAITK